MIETPTATAFTIEPAESDDTDDTDAPLLSADQKPSEKTSATEPELFLIKSKPITSRIRTTIKHLRKEAGPWSRFRGLQVAVITHFVHQVLFRFFVGLVPSAMITEPIVAVATTVILCRLEMTWTHVVISAPTVTRWFRRIPSTKSGRNIILPTMVYAIAQQVALYMPIALYQAFGLNRFHEDPSHFGEISEEARKMVMKQYFLVALSGLLMAVLIVFPASVSLTRVQASMLPEENESIVPFDRTFGGKVKPEILGGSGAVSMLDAWKTFGWAARIRLVKLYAKIGMIQVVTTVLFVMMVVGELRLIMGDELQKMTEKGVQHVMGHN